MNFKVGYEVKVVNKESAWYKYVGKLTQINEKYNSCYVNFGKFSFSDTWFELSDLKLTLTKKRYIDSLFEMYGEV